MYCALWPLQERLRLFKTESAYQAQADLFLWMSPNGCRMHGSARTLPCHPGPTLSYDTIHRITK